MTTYLHKFKCLKCSLHFIIFSWHDRLKHVACPECGNDDDLFDWIDESDEPIFRFVPGHALPESLAREAKETTGTYHAKDYGNVEFELEGSKSGKGFFNKVLQFFRQLK